MGERDRGVPYGGNEETFWITQARGNPGGKEITMDEIKLKPCPFCGAPAQYKELGGRWAVECTRHCVATRIMADKKKVSEAWNRRADNG